MDRHDVLRFLGVLESAHLLDRLNVRQRHLKRRVLGLRPDPLTDLV